MKLQSLFIICLCSLLLSSCNSYKKVPYLQDADMINSLQEPFSTYDARIMPKDLLTITVNTSDPESAAPFNLSVQSTVSITRSTSLTQQPTLQQYLVSNDGTIDFPVLGRLQIAGLTKSEAENLIRKKLGEIGRAHV